MPYAISNLPPTNTQAQRPNRSPFFLKLLLFIYPRFSPGYEDHADTLAARPDHDLARPHSSPSRLLGEDRVWVPLQASSTHQLLTFHQTQATPFLESLSADGLLSLQTSDPLASQYALLDWADSSLVSPASLLELGLDSSLVQQAVPAYHLPDGSVVGLLPRLVFRLRRSVDSATVCSTLRAHAKVLALEHHLDEVISIEVATLDDLWPVQQFLWQQNWPAWCQPDFLVSMEPADPYSADQFYLNNIGQTVDGQSGLVDMDIDAPEAWALSTGDSNVVVAVFDNGLEAHEDLETGIGNSRVLPGHAIVGTGNGGPQVSQEGHGMGCAGIIAASHNSIGVRGVAPQVSLLPIYAPLTYLVPISAIANGITWAWQLGGADIINCSWALPSCSATPYPALAQAIRQAMTQGRANLGTVLVFAAGNDTLTCVRFPAMMDSTIAAGAIDLQGNPAVYANRGLALDVVAPSAGAGPNNVRTIDRLGADGINSNGSNDLPNIDYTRNFGGTSSAAALSSGVAALLLSVYPNLTAADVQQVLRDGADDMGPTGLDVDFGYGRLNAYAALQEGSTYGPLAAFNQYLSPTPSESSLIPNPLDALYPCQGGWCLSQSLDMEPGDVLALHDATGRLCTRKVLSADQPDHSLLIPAPHQAGVYLLEWSTPTGKRQWRRLLWR